VQLAVQTRVRAKTDVRYDSIELAFTRVIAVENHRPAIGRRVVLERVNDRARPVPHAFPGSLA